ncbi:MAG: D-tyrosyl-tRNA(Tyr) deacylase [Methanocalculus sp. MSAO_Arc2]|uniref:D-aminoacyl-tRNA deacylase n=1 Tax=Methanocalculus sp. MSAO_Arc2 TaxID=2293855 RepID=UPI000FF4FB5E|nr:MAG: D-tyrosyl-tRNA(Tyr) deacylase [Methanocalculus sp. MSAO_Arc2]
MVTALVHSRLDPAGVAIRSAIDDIMKHDRWAEWPLLLNGVVFHETEGRLIYEEGLDRRIDADRIIFLSRHTSKNPEPVLTVHVTGNFDEAAFGGRPNELSKADPAMMQAVLKNLIRYAPDGYRAGYEVTHHGPGDLTTPSFFVEIGSTEKEWHDPVAARVVARCVLSAEPGAVVPLIGFGGTHYAVRQTAIAAETRGAFGHIAHSRDAALITQEKIRLMAEQTGAVAGYIDKKAVSGSVASTISNLLTSIGLPILTEGMLREMGELSWETWCRAAELASKVSPGAMMKNHGLWEDCTLTTVEIHEELLNEALWGDNEEFISLLDTITPCIRITTNGRTALPVFIVCQKRASQLASDLITLCVQQITKHSLSVIEGDHLIIRRDRFDPEKARKFGVQPGPLFGRLASGQEVSVDGRVIRPEMVSSRVVREIRIPGLERYT